MRQRGHPASRVGTGTMDADRPTLRAPLTHGAAPPTAANRPLSGRPISHGGRRPSRTDAGEGEEVGNHAHHR